MISMRPARFLPAAFAAVVALVFFSSSFSARAIGPHEIMLVVNDESIDSILLAKVYQRLRSVPDANLLRVSVPADAFDATGTTISPEDFTKHIWKPIADALDKPEFQRQALAVVFSCGFPVKVAPKELSKEMRNETGIVPISITGAVFVRNKLPSSKEEWEVVDKGRFASELFAGPVNVGSHAGESETFDTSRARLLANMPLPAMMLAFTGERGSTVEQAMEYLERSAGGDYKNPEGTVWFAVNNDIRSQCRQWEFGQATNELAHVPGIRAVVSTGQPRQPDFPLVGYMTGARDVRPGAFKFAPGAFADHLTSFGAVFEIPAQTKVTEWLIHGAAFTAGTVTEPMSIWMKFPHACIFTHQLNGCTAIEAMYLSLLSPLQTLPLGDPLANPWGEEIRAGIIAPEGELSGQVEFTAEVENERADVFYRFQWFVDGKFAGNGRTLMLDTRNNIRDGSHKVRVVARRQLESVRQQGFAEITVRVKNGK
ncbi:MAG: TIGR03790 family protein [Kiritimatiellaeota bacterium]|nr:TIGR03790 family protein [Kiritimatiellota bacterium]